MSHVLMVGVGAHGHTNPHLPVVAELVERGHRVSYAIPAPFAEAVAATGADPLVITSTLPDETRDEQWPTDPVTGMGLFLDDAVLVLPQLEAALADDRPDVVLYDIGGYAGRALAHRWGVPLVQLSPSIVAWEGYEEDMAEALAFLREPDGIAYAERFDGWLRGLGIDMPWTEFSGRPPRCVVLVPKVMQPHADRVDESVYTFVGPGLDRRREAAWPEPDRPLLLVSLGSAYTDRVDFYRDCVAAFGDLDRRVVIAIGRHVDPVAVGPVPPNVELHPWVPQFAVLARASAFVTHAGMGGCSEGLYQGVPMVAVPQAVDQPGNAAMLEALGVGVTVPPESVTPAVLRDAVLSLIGSPEVAARSAALRDELRAAGGARAAADVVEAQLPR
ncbi:macrolide family glycosyltransferase [Pseudonocardia lacus]|uniref:macrolide family glycosyltransferase n=1 Tax=Pseudonocardia lacus TaxID=2835865 RepID=UPI001BDCE1F1|nr:macrolide family glycosyltransferase [Pseudonocardia lacus]